MELSSEQTKGLVFVQNDKPVTDSLKIAEAFQKGHDKVLRDIRGLKCSEGFRLSNFGESSYTNKQGRMMPMYVVTFDGFAMLAMGYSGEKAMHFKESYINEFNKTRYFLESQQNTLLAAEQKQLRNEIAHEIHSRFYHVPDKARRKYFSQLYSELKKHFEVESYRDISRQDFHEALIFIKNIWDSPKLESTNKE